MGVNRQLVSVCIGCIAPIQAIQTDTK